MRYFQTDIASRPIVAEGQIVPWDSVGVHAGMLVGVLKTESEPVVQAVLAGRATWEITEAEYQALAEKKTPYRSPVLNPLKPAPKVPPPFATIQEDGRVGHVVASVPKSDNPEAKILKTPTEYLKLSKVESPDILPKPVKKGKKSQ